MLNYFPKGKASCIQDKLQGENLPDKRRMAEDKDDLRGRITEATQANSSWMPALSKPIVFIIFWFL